jgi:tetratricopeptide (TPR) repeat protein
MLKVKIAAIGTLVIISCTNNFRRKQNQNPNIVLLEKADSCYQNKDFVHAIIYYGSLIKLDSLNGQYYYKRAYSKSMLFDLDGAIVDYSKTIKLNPERKNAYLSIGMIYFATKHYQEAIPFLDKCLDIDPNDKMAKKFKESCLNKLVKEI